MKHTIIFIVGLLTIISCNKKETPKKESLKKEYRYYGIDISHHQDTSIWRYLNTDTLSFVYIKASQAVYFKDPLCVAHYKKAKEHGIKHIGFYHFYSIKYSPTEQYRNFKSQLSKVKLSLSPAIDFEHKYEVVKTQKDSVRARKLKEKIFKDFLTFYNLIKKDYGEPVIYINWGDYKMYFQNCKIPFKIWIPNNLNDNRQMIYQQRIITKNNIKIDFNYAKILPLTREME